MSAVAQGARASGRKHLRRAVDKHDEGRRLVTPAVCDGHVQAPLLALRVASLLALRPSGRGEGEGLRGAQTTWTSVPHSARHASPVPSVRAAPSGYSSPWKRPSSCSSSSLRDGRCGRHGGQAGGEDRTAAAAACKRTGFRARCARTVDLYALCYVRRHSSRWRWRARRGAQSGTHARGRLRLAVCGSRRSQSRLQTARARRARNARRAVSNVVGR